MFIRGFSPLSMLTQPLCGHTQPLSGKKRFYDPNGRKLTGYYVFKGFRLLTSRHNSVDTVDTHTTTLKSTLTSMRVYTTTVWEKVLPLQTAHITNMSVHTSNVWKTLFVGL